MYPTSMGIGYHLLQCHTLARYHDTENTASHCHVAACKRHGYLNWGCEMRKRILISFILRAVGWAFYDLVNLFDRGTRPPLGTVPCCIKLVLDYISKVIYLHKIKHTDEPFSNFTWPTGTSMSNGLLAIVACLQESPQKS